MAYIFFFKCLSCDYYIVLSEGNRGWIDNKGNFGRAVIDGTILGEPDGGTYIIWYDIKLCINCGKIYYTLGGDTHGIKVKQEQVIKERNVFIPNVFILANEENCPKCKIKLQQGLEILKQVINRDKCWKFKFDPIESENKALICPNCKNEFLRYEQFWLAD
jgi:hypothetical protein